ncbi:MAG: radical SAM protein [Bacteroidales bacterium]|nr:radical SAM protein [Bacteroidales bacterium]
MKKFELTSEFLIIPDSHNKDCCYVYFPIKSLIIKGNKDTEFFLEHFKSKKVIETKNRNHIKFLTILEQAGVVNGEPDKDPGPFTYDRPMPTGVTLIPTNRCNLKCLYCFNNSEIKGSDLSEEIAYRAVDLLVKNALEQSKKQIDVFFHGGGEPTQNWSLVMSVINYAKEVAANNNLSVRFGICTNAICGEETMMDIIDNFESILVSADGKPDIQNLQRPLHNGKPSFPVLERNLKLLSRYKKRYSIRITVSSHHKNRLDKDVEFLCQQFNPTSIIIEPLHECGRCVTTSCQPMLPENFIEEVVRCYQVMEKHNKPLQYSGSKLQLTNRFCGTAGSNFFITPEGDVTACLEVTRRSDKRSKVFFYGYYNNESKCFQFDLDKYRNLASMRVSSFEDCKLCFAKWHCGGDCLAKAPDSESIGKIRNPYRCFVNKNLIKYQLLREFNKKKITLKPISYGSTRFTS